MATATKGKKVIRKRRERKNVVGLLRRPGLPRFP